MTFSELLNQYMETLSCTARELSDASGVSQATISRYRHGEIEPPINGSAFHAIIGALAEIAGEKGIDLSEDEIRIEAVASLTEDDALFKGILQKLRSLLSELNIRNAEFARGVSYDPSYISRILSGANKPADLEGFTAQTASFIRQYVKTNHISLSALCTLYGCTEEELNAPNGVFEKTVEYLGYAVPREVESPMSRFLDKMETFNLDDFIRTIHFNDIKLPTAPFQLPTTKEYNGIQEMMESELDFIKATVLSRSKKDCILYSDMPLEEMAKDPEFPKKWMFGRAMMLKKGLHLHIIHDVNRPFHEMMLGLEGHIPMYMTGQISPYYLTTSQSAVFNHLLNVSGAAALEGHAIAGHQSSGRYMLYKSKEDVRHFRARAEQLLEKAQPLMDIYRSERKEDFFIHLKKLWESDDRKVVASSLPIYTISDDLLESILKRNHIPENSAEIIREFYTEYREAAEKRLREYRVTLVIPELSREQFERSPLNLSLAELFFETDVPYTYEEYAIHLEQTKKFSQRHGNMKLELDDTPAFRNISYAIIGNRLVIVSKNKFPTIHFVIHHKRMVKAFLDFIPPIRE